MLPTIEQAGFSLDLRAIRDGDRFKLVPVVIARLGFDEPTAGGLTVVFQIPDEAIEELLAGLRGIVERRGQIVTELGDWID